MANKKRKSWHFMNAALLRANIESTLADRFPSALTYREPAVLETISVPAIAGIAAGLPRGGLAEICGPASSGRTAFLLSALAEATRQGEYCALADGWDTLDPHSAASAGIDLSRLLWIRCRQVEQALRAAELLLEGGGFGVVAIDFGDVPASLLRRVPLSIWFRLRWVVRNTRTALLLVEREPSAGSSASLVVRLAVGQAGRCGVFRSTAGHLEPRPSSHARLLSGFQSHVEALRSRRSLQPCARVPFKAQAVWR